MLPAHHIPPVTTTPIPVADGHTATPSSATGRDAEMEFAATILRFLDYDPNEEQTDLIAGFARFCVSCSSNELLLLNGYAGTGKTSLTGALVKTLTHFGMKSVLLAPTGRAAKVFSEYAGHPAYTIHRKIYRQHSYSPEDMGGFNIADNKHTDTIFIIDEASMIANTVGDGGGAAFGTGRLLDDLIHYVYSGTGCRLIMLGDSAQLPPVGLDESPALSESAIAAYGLRVMAFTLHHVARQRQNSGILENATLLRHAIEAYSHHETASLQPPVLHTSGYDDICNVSSEFLIDNLSSSYGRLGVRGTTLITRSNKRAAGFNLGIRNSIMCYEDELVSGDLLMVAKNNYLWSENYQGLDFIANGEMARVVRTRGMEEQMYGLRFMRLELELPDLDVEIEAKAVLDALYSDAAALTRQQSEQVYVGVMSQLQGDKRTRYRALKKDPYYNALQVKYGYAVTCHKAQGGQWEDVYIDMGGIPPEALTDIQFYRWLYTAITRARTRVFLINSPLPSR